ncbi:MAG: hypothetical protein JWO11_2193 [Nocardioides sp.]|jgi:hypothetical protein|nr:hypothetical protein [Nocardioides sp.]
MKYALLAASLVLVAGSAVGCGGDGGGGASAPTKVSTAEFCSAFADAFAGIMSAGTQGGADAVKALKDGVAGLSDTGTPENIPANARHGFEVFVKAINDLDDNADLASMDNLPGVSKADEADATAFIEWAVGECPGAISGLPSGLPTDIPSTP